MINNLEDAISQIASLKESLKKAEARIRKLEKENRELRYQKFSHENIVYNEEKGAYEI